MNRITAMVEITNPTKYNDAQVPSAPDSLVGPALSIMRAIRTQRVLAPARMIDDYAFTLESPMHLYLRAFRSYPSGG